MKRALNRFERFWFDPVGVTGFGLMRVAFGLLALGSFVPQWSQIERFYGGSGLLPIDVTNDFLRSEFRLTVFNYIGEPNMVFAVYLLLIFCLVCVTLGIFTRTTMITSAILIFSFHERQPIILAGGDTLLRNLAFILAVSPCHRSYSLWNVKRRYKVWKEKQKEAPALTMPAWPYRLLLWQIIMMYVGSVWTKAIGTMWWDGSAVGIAVHHEHFARFSRPIANAISSLGVFEAAFVLVSQSLWPLLLLIPVLHTVLPYSKRIIQTRIVRRAAVVCDSMVHIGILITMEVGIFSSAVLTGLIGTLKDEDFVALRRFINRWSRGKTVVLYDGHCGLCLRSVFVLRTLDSLDRLKPVDFHEDTLRKKIAPKITLQALDKALHVKLPNGTFRMGFRAFRAISWSIPWLWVFAPFLYLPGAVFIGDRVYDRIAKRRKKCRHGHCLR